MDDEILQSIKNEMQAPQRQLASPQSDIDAEIQSEIQQEMREEMYGTPSQKLIGFGEAVTRGLVSSPIATGIEEALGVPTENIAGRKEQLGSVGEFVGEGVGLILPTLATAGASTLAKAGLAPLSLATKAQSLAKFSQAGMLTAAGEMAAKKAVTEAGKKAAAMGLESAIFAAGDEITKAMLSEHPSAPMERIQSAAVNVGASALFGSALGFGIGKISPIWKAKFGPQTQAELDKINSQIVTDPSDFGKVAESVVSEKERSEILKGLTELKPNYKEIEKAGERLGAPTPEGMISKSKLIQKTDSSLTKSASLIGEGRNKLYQKGFDAVDNAVAGVLKTDLPEELSKADLGNLIADQIEPQVRATKNITDELYNVVSRETGFVPADKKRLNNFIEETMNSLRVKANKRSPTYTVTKALMDDLAEQDTVEGIRAVIADMDTRFAGDQKLRSLGYELKDKANDLVVKSIKNHAKNMMVPDIEAKNAIQSLLGQLNEANKIYGPFRNKLRLLSKGLGFKISGPADFLIKLREMKPETLVNKIYAKENAEFVKLMAEEFPNELKLVTDFQKRELLKAASKRDKLKTTGLIDKILAMPKELRSAMFSEKELQTIQDARLWLNNLPENVNISNTSQGIMFNEYWQSPLKAAQITLADASKLAMVKFLKSSAPTSAAGFKVMGDYVISAQAGMALLSKAATNVLLNKEVYPKSLEPKDSKLRQLDARAMELGLNPRAMIDASGDLGYYMPEESTALAATMSRITNYLNSVRPTPKQGGMLGKEIPLSQAQLADYKRTLQIAEQPLIVLKKLQKGNITSKDIKDLNAMYPEVRNMLLDKITRNIVEIKSQGKQIPFTLRKSLSIFTGMPLDNTMSPQSIQSAQATYQMQQQPQQQALPQMAKKSSRKSQLPNLTETDQQRRMLNR